MKGLNVGKRARILGQDMVDVNGRSLAEGLGIDMQSVRTARSQGRLLRLLKEKEIPITQELAARIEDRPVEDGPATDEPVTEERAKVPVAPAPAPAPAPAVAPIAASDVTAGRRQLPPPREALISFTIRIPAPLHEWMRRHAFEFRTTHQAMAIEAFEGLKAKIERGN